MKLSYIYTMEYYSAIKRSECESVELRWMNLESVIQSEVSQKEKSFIINAYICNLGKMVLMNLFTGQEERRRE